MDTKKVISGRPLQRLSWTEKNSKDGQWFKENADYYISQSTFAGLSQGNTTGSGSKHEMRTMYNVYNNNIPMSWFTHITDPLSATNPKHKNFPAKIRPTNILRTTLDQLMAEWTRRPFRYRVENMGEDGYNRFLDSQNQVINQNLMEMFTAMFQEQLTAQGMEEEITNITPDQVPVPEETKKKFRLSYKDKVAVKAQKWLKRSMVEYGVNRVLLKGFKDYLISGEVITYKDVVRGDLVYKRLSPLYADYDKSPDTDFIEDGDWFTYVHLMTPAQIVDEFYDELTDKHHETLEHHALLSSPTAFYDHISGLSADTHGHLIPVYQVLWRGRKQVGIVKYTDPVTGEVQEYQIDEAEKDMLKDFGENLEVEWRWVNEVYETWRITEDIYVRKQAVIAQRSALNNFSVNKLPANGRKYSDTHAPNISVLKIGIPYLIMYMIVNRTLELTIAKSKGKILIMDNNAIPRSKGWNEEKFFYYSEAMGYALLDRNQIGVDKGWNQYSVQDLSLFENIQQLIMLAQHYKDEWDNIIGMTPQRKGQTFASETNSSNERSVFQSTLITEMIFIGFDEFAEKELQGLIDLSKFVNATGLRKMYNRDEEDDAIGEVTPEEYSSAEIGVLITDNPQDANALDAMKSLAPEFIQNGTKASTILTMYQNGNIAEMKADLLMIEELQQKAEQMAGEQQAAAQEAADNRALEFMEFEKVLEEQLINTEYDRKVEIEQIKGSFNIASYDNKETAATDADTTADLLKHQAELTKQASAERMQARDIASKERMARFKEYVSLRKQQAIEANKKKIADDKVKADIKKARISARAKKSSK